VAVPGRSYEIHVRGDLDPALLEELPEVVAGTPVVQTVLYGAHLDQAALHGVIDRLEALGLELIEVRKVGAADE
jgi:hypothetical protein